MTFSKILTLVSKNKKISSTHNVFQMAYENWCIFFFDITPKFILAKYEVSKIQNKYQRPVILQKSHVGVKLANQIHFSLNVPPGE